VLIRLGRDEEALEALGRAAWDGAWHRAAAFEAACLLARQGRTALARRDADDAALDGVEPRLTALRVVLARREGDRDAADRMLHEEISRGIPDDLIRHLADGSLPEDGLRMFDLAVDLDHLGETEAALSMLSSAVLAPATTTGNVAPVAHYLRAALLERLGRRDDAARERQDARDTDRRWAFPSGLDAHDALVAALRADADDAVAAGLLGEMLYQEGRRAEAARLWERAVQRGSDDAVMLRNAGLAAYNVTHDDDLAWRRYEQARGADPNDARLLSEQDQLAAKLGHPAQERLARLQAALPVVDSRDDLAIAYADLLRLTGDAAGALEWMDSRRFQPWEGGEGRALAAWDAARDALSLPQIDPPESLGEHRPVHVPPVAVHEDGSTDYFATSLPESLLFHRSR
jgi:tetratricopeptide (TPR) repeat protein